MKFFIFIILFGVYFLAPDLFIGNILTFSLVLFIGVFIEFIRGFGQRIHPLDLMGLYASVVYLLSPALSYYLTEIDWYEGFNFMCIPKERYFSVALPGTLALLAGVNFPFKISYSSQNHFFDQIADYLKDRTDAGYKLFWIGLGAHFVLPFAPGGLGFFMELAAQLIYIGGLYLYFSPMEKSKKMPFMVVMIFIPLVKALRLGMFGEVVFWGAFMAMLMMLKYDIAFWKKLVFASVGIVFILFIQSIKYEYRQLTWFSSQASDDLGYKLDVFQDLWEDRLENPDMLYGPYMLSNALDRTNQGSLVAMSIRYVPEYEPFAKGETIFLATAASFVPRFVWPDKPTVGGREKMIRFTGFDNGEITAMDIGQLGDAYVNFGTNGGAIFMFFYGLFFAFFYAQIFKIGEKGMLSIIIWIPLFFAGVVQMDGSVLACLNHIIKSAMFTYIVIVGYKKFFGTQL